MCVRICGWCGCVFRYVGGVSECGWCGCVFGYVGGVSECGCGRVCMYFCDTHLILLYMSVQRDRN